MRKVLPPMMHAMVAEGLYVGNITAGKNLEFLSNADISAVINLTGEAFDPVEYVDVFPFRMADQELMEAEIPRMLTKLADIDADITCLRAAGRSVLIICADGKNRCMVVAGYYLAGGRANSAKPMAGETLSAERSGMIDVIIERLELLYLSEEQRAAELAERRHILEDHTWLQSSEAAMEPAVLAASREARAVRRDLKCLTYLSFQKIIRGASVKK